jgi:hypothetical protein
VKNRLVVAAFAALVMAFVSAPGLRAQGDTQQSLALAPPVTLKVTVTISRWDGEKKLATAPYILMATPSYGKAAEEGRDGDATSLQMGSEVPVPNTTISDGKPTPSFQYRPLGTNITVAARPTASGQYLLYVSVQYSEVDSPQPGMLAPRFQNFRASNRLALRDGQTVQYTVATDTITGHVTKLDVTMNVVK